MVYEIQTIIRLMIETWMIVLWMIVSYPILRVNSHFFLREKASLSGIHYLCTLTNNLNIDVIIGMSHRSPSVHSLFESACYWTKSL